MHCHCGTNNRAPQWTFTDPCKPEVRPGARGGVSVSCLASRTRHECLRHNESVYMEALHWMWTDTEESVTATTHQEKGIITLDSNASRGTSSKMYKIISSHQSYIPEDMLSTESRMLQGSRGGIAASPTCAER